MNKNRTTSFKKIYPRERLYCKAKIIYIDGGKIDE
ncbi:hypothetical protein M918_17150 [Clostridium sp. BL8]|nr:hypothetical protein M918_17150 [Clostridium sp. BL8]